MDIKAVLNNLETPHPPNPPAAAVFCFVLDFRANKRASTIKYLYTSVCNIISSGK